MDVLAARVGGVLKSHGYLLATAESCTGGGVAQAVTDIAGSSAWFDRGFVTYSNAAKVEMLGVDEATLSRHGAVSEAVVREMVRGALLHSDAQVALAITGIAGPGGGSPDKPVGTVWFAWAVRDRQLISRMHNLQGTRAEIRAGSVHLALQGVLDVLANVTYLT